MDGLSRTIDLTLIGTMAIGGTLMAALMWREGHPWAPWVAAGTVGWTVLLWVTWIRATPARVLADLRRDEPETAPEVETVPIPETIPETVAVPDSPAALETVPTGGEVGYWVGLTLYGPGWTDEEIQVRTDPNGWERPEVDPPVCPDCDATSGLSLAWVTSRPDIGRLWCPCGAIWRRDAWEGEDAAWWADLQEVPPVVPGRVSGDDVDPTIAFQAALLRREVGNAPTP
uniref:PNPL.20 n=1 Tax=Nocardiopsis sp. 25L-1-1c TaxID=1009683 RepID=R4HCG3_9ACTN|nr:pNPL.20 [Nocardiopsis sp. 25L-1-1c]